MKYTEKFHAKRLMMMLGKKDICGRDLCPAGKWFSGRGDRLQGLGGPGPCLVCQGFVGAKSDCPCYYFGGELAIKKTIQALKKKGYM